MTKNKTIWGIIFCYAFLHMLSIAFQFSCEKDFLQINRRITEIESRIELLEEQVELNDSSVDIEKLKKIEEDLRELRIEVKTDIGLLEHLRNLYYD